MKQCAVLLLLTTIIIFSGCNDVIHQRQNSSLQQFMEEPITISWDGDTKDGVQSYQANVQVFSKNNRKDTYASLSQSYRIAIKNIDDRVVTRIDFDADKDSPSHAIISDGEEAIIFNPITEEISLRVPFEDSDSPLYRIFEGQSGLSRINLSLIRKEAQRLALDITEDSTGNTLLLELPPSMIPQNGYDKITRSRAVFDIANETLIETEVVMVREDETIVTTTATPVYEDKDGVPVKVGMVTVIDSKASFIEDFDSGRPIINSLDDIPTLSESDYAAMKEAGNIHEVPDMVFGNPADPGYVLTIYEVYRDIEINTAPDSLFRLIQK